MKIEVISRRPKRASKYPPLLFVHGAYGGAWAGQLRWGKLTHARVLGVLKNPCYAGAYVHGVAGQIAATDGPPSALDVLHAVRPALDAIRRG